MPSKIERRKKVYLGMREPRTVRGYPKKKYSGVRRKKRGAIKGSLRQARPRRHATSWKYRTKNNWEKALEDRAIQGVRGSLQERIVYQKLLDYGLIDGVDFTFQTQQLGGRMELGGLVADFLFPYIMVVVQVQSYWHNVGNDIRQRDADQETMLTKMGYYVIEIWPTTIEDEAQFDRWMDTQLIPLFKGQGVVGSGRR
jgi:very-short-patch-repair endonuclease